MLYFLTLYDLVKANQNKKNSLFIPFHKLFFIFNVGIFDDGEN